MTSETRTRRGRLVLTRRAGESVEIGDVTVTVHEFTSGGGVKLVVEAPTHVRIMRSELVDGAEERPGSTGQGGC